jgi:predicted Zn finger-like uncharacterized protein
LAYKVIIQCSDAEDIVRLLKKSHGADYSRIWRIDGRTIGVFSFERGGLVTYAGYVNLVTLDHDRSTELCDITIIGAGGGVPSILSLWEMDDSGIDAVDDLVKLAKERNWPIETSVAEIKFRGTPCPKCSAAYVYSEDKIDADGTVSCQNCGTRFNVKE